MKKSSKKSRQTYSIAWNWEKFEKNVQNTLCLKNTFLVQAYTEIEVQLMFT